MVLVFRTFWHFGQFNNNYMRAVVKIAVHMVCAVCTHFYTKYKSVIQPCHTVVKTICVQIRICTKTFRDIVSNCVDTKNWDVLYNFVNRTIHPKVKWKGSHRHLQKSNVMFYIEKFDEKIDCDRKWYPALYKTLFFHDFGRLIGYNFSASYDLFYARFSQNMGRYCKCLFLMLAFTEDYKNIISYNNAQKFQPARCLFLLLYEILIIVNICYTCIHDVASNVYCCTCCRQLLQIFYTIT